MKELEFYEFTEFWNNYIAEITKGEDINKLWNDNSKWTELVLSDKLSKKLVDEFKLVGKNKVWKEWRKFDLIIGTNNYFQDVYNYDMSGLLLADDDISSYPKHQLLLLEHENDFKTCMNELIKLTYERALIKVLITYPETIKQRLAIVNNTLNILSQSDTSISEVSEYILIFGEMLDVTIYWTFYEIGYNGVLVNSHLFTNTGLYKNVKDLTLKDFITYPIWQDYKTVRFKSSRNQIRRIDAVKPNKLKDDTIIHNSELLGYQDYNEDFFVYTIFTNNETTFDGYVRLDTDYDFRRGIEFEKQMSPVIIKDKSQIPLDVVHKSYLPLLYNKLNSSSEKLFPLKYEIQANVEGFLKTGLIKGFIMGDMYIK